ncbi:MAG TPA: HAD-IIIA family hydrolase [Rhizomicrobium sp.]|nr:HAD-IIIA family hydrolase [Rhizomicrobium sp.]
MLSQAVFLVGGLGTRLKERTRATPKPLLDVGGRPFLEYLLDEATRQSFTEILLLAGHFGDQVRTLYDGRKWRGAQIRVLCENEPLGTGGALRFALPHLKPHFLLANGDSFFDINLRALSADLPEGGAAMALRNVVGDRYGRVKLEGNRVLSFHASQENIKGPINGGIYAISRAIVETIPDGKFSLESDIFPSLATRGGIRGRTFDSYFIDIGVPQDLERAQTDLPRHVRRPAVFFDRDGVLNRDTGYLHRPEEFEWLEGAKSAIRLCNDAGYFVFVVTNQAGVARGYYDESDVENLHVWMRKELALEGAHIDAFEYCPHHLDGVRPEYRRACPRRKPEPGMILDLLADWPVDKGASFLIGNTQSDLDAAAAAGIAAHLYQGGDLAAFVASLLKTRLAPG